MLNMANGDHPLEQDTNNMPMENPIFPQGIRSEAIFEEAVNQTLAPAGIKKGIIALEKHIWGQTDLPRNVNAWDGHSLDVTITGAKVEADLSLRNEPSSHPAGTNSFAQWFHEVNHIANNYLGAALENWGYKDFVGSGGDLLVPASASNFAGMGLPAGHFYGGLYEATMIAEPHH
jgi:hypothetical protein